MKRGFVKLWRLYLENGFIRNHKLWAFWTWCLLKASHKQHEHMVGNQLVFLMPGQFVFGRKRAAEELGMSEQEIRTAVSSLKKSGHIASMPTSKYSIITITNWGTYQSPDVGPKPTRQPVTNQHITTNNNDNNEKKLATGNHYFEWYWVGYPNKNGEKNAKAEAWAAWREVIQSEERLDLLTVGTTMHRAYRFYLEEQNLPFPELPSAVEWIRGRQWENWEKEIPREAIPFVDRVNKENSERWSIHERDETRS